MHCSCDAPALCTLYLNYFISCYYYKTTFQQQECCVTTTHKHTHTSTPFTACVPLIYLYIGMTHIGEWALIPGFIGGKAQLDAYCHHLLPYSLHLSSLPFLIPALLPLPSSLHVPNASSALWSLTSDPDRLSEIVFVPQWWNLCELKNFGHKN